MKMAAWAPAPTIREAANPHVVGKQRQLSGVIRRDVRIGRHGVHVVGHDDRQGADPGQVPGQLGMPGGCEDLIHALVAFAGKGSFMRLQHFFETVANAPVGAVKNDPPR